MLFFLRNTKAESSANTPNPAVAVAFSPVLANCLSPLAAVWEVFWEIVFSTSTFLLSLLSTWPKMFCGVAWASSFNYFSILNAGNSGWIKASPLSVTTGLVESVDGVGVTGTGVSWLDATVFTIVYKLKWLVKNVSFPSL